MFAQSTPITCTLSERRHPGTRANTQTDGLALPAVTVAVPVFNNGGSLKELHRRLISSLADITSHLEIIYVNDGSTDDSLQVLSRICGSNLDVRIIDFARNFGQSAAILAALEESTQDIVVTIDADLENRPEDVPSLIAAVQSGADLACGVRQRRNSPRLGRKLPSWVANRLVGSALSLALNDWGCGLNAVSSGLVRKIVSKRPLPGLPKIEAAMLAATIIEIPVRANSRSHGLSQYTPRRLCAFAASFLRDFAIARCLMRLLGRGQPAAQIIVADGAVVKPAWYKTVFQKAVGFVSWLLLSAASVAVRIGDLLHAGRPGGERYQIREIVERTHIG